MKIALLICDHVPQELSDVHGNYSNMFNRLLDNIDLDPYYVIDGKFPDLSVYNAFVVTGSKYSVYDDIQWIHDLKLFTAEIYRLKKKMVGVCFGHQLITEALGGKVEKSHNGYLIGIHDFHMMDKRSWMLPDCKSYKTLMLCQDQVQTLPPDSTILSTSPECPIGMFILGDCFLGIQGHPEFSIAYNQAVFESRIKKIGKEKVENAIASFKDETDNDLLAGYINNFLKSK